MTPDPPKNDWLRRSIITVRLLRNFFQLLQKLWTTLCLFLQNIVSHAGVFAVLKSHVGHVNHGNLKIYRGVGVSSTFLAVMRCSYYFFAVLRYPEPPNAPSMWSTTECSVRSNVEYDRMWSTTECSVRQKGVYDRVA